MIVGPCAERLLQSRSVKVNVFKVWWSMRRMSEYLKASWLAQGPPRLMLRLDMMLIIGEWHGVAMDCCITCLYAGLRAK
jgi:hypothetical protein